MKYHIVWILGGGKPWWIWWITGGLPNVTVQSLAMSHDINKGSKQTGICQSFPSPNIHTILYISKTYVQGLA